MSILIKGMEMPKSCVSCRWYKKLGCELEDLVTNAVQGCPLTEVPASHGRLVDINDVYEVLTEQYHQRTEIQHIALQEALSKVPTIVEREDK